MCTESISKCGNCGFSRHIDWMRCEEHIYALAAAIEKLKTPPHPSDCEHCTRPMVTMWLTPRACPTSNEGCGGLRAAANQEKKDKDEGAQETGAAEHMGNGDEAARSAESAEDGGRAEAVC